MLMFPSDFIAIILNQMNWVYAYMPTHYCKMKMFALTLWKQAEKEEFTSLTEGSKIKLFEKSC